VFVAAVLLWRRHLGVPTANALTGAPAETVWRNVTGALAHYVPLTLRGAQGPTVLAWRPPSTATAALWSALVPAAAAALYALRRRAPATAERLALGLVWLAAFAASSALAAPATGQHANRYLYPAIAGASLAVGAALDAVIAAGPRARRVALAAVAAVAAVFAAVSARQAPRWRSGLALFGADLPAGRDDARVLYHYGVSLARRDGCAAALPYFRRAAALEPGYPRAWHNVTGCLLQLGRAAEAIEPGRRALRLAPYDISCALNLGAAYALSGDRARAEPLLRRGCAARPGHPACRLLPGR
jgi:tetratricopeptide (TPR) repeat protein